MALNSSLKLRFLPTATLSRLLKTEVDGVTLLWAMASPCASPAISSTPLHVELGLLGSFNLCLAGKKIWAVFAPVHFSSITTFLASCHCASTASINIPPFTAPPPLSPDLNPSPPPELWTPIPPPPSASSTPSCPHSYRHRNRCVSPHVITSHLGIEPIWFVAPEESLVLLHPKAFHCVVNIGRTFALSQNFMLPQADWVDGMIPDWACCDESVDAPLPVRT